MTDTSTTGTTGGADASAASLNRTLGRSDLVVGPIAYGFWRFAGTSTSEARAKVERALELGMTLFDHADIYGVDGGGSFGDAEALFGEVMREAPQLRERFVLATKGGIVLGVPYDSSAEYLKRAVDDSLRRLNVDVIDLYQIHRPDFLTHPAALAQTLEELRSSGKVREFGVSNYTASQTRALQAHLSFDLITAQPEWSCWSHGALRDGVLDLCMEREMTPLGWSPLAGGRLATSVEEARAALDAQPNDPNAKRLFDTVSALDALAKRYEVSPTAVAIAWTMRHPAGVIPIIGTQRLERMSECVSAAQVQLTRAEWNEVLVAAQGYPLP